MLTPKQEAFLAAYARTGNATDAYREAFGEQGLSNEAIKQRASRLLRSLHGDGDKQESLSSVTMPTAPVFGDKQQLISFVTTPTDFTTGDKQESFSSIPVASTVSDVGDKQELLSFVTTPGISTSSDKQEPLSSVTTHTLSGTGSLGNNAVWLDFNDPQPDTNSITLTPNPEAIAAYFDLVFSYCDGMIPLRGLTDPGQGLANRPHHIWVEANTQAATKAVTFAQWAANNGAAFYVIPGTVAERGQARADEVTQLQAVLVDLDNGDVEAKLGHLSRYLGDPTAIIESGGVTPEGQNKLHAYWKLSEPAEGNDLALVCRLRYEIALKVDGDPHFRSAHQPIRVAGSVYHKNGRKRLTTFRTLSHQEYHLRDLAESVANLPTMAGIDTSSMDFNTASPAKPPVDAILTTPVRAEAQDAWTRFEGASAAIGHFVRMAHEGRMNRQEAWEAIRQYNAAMLRPPWQEERLAVEAQRLWEKHCEKYGAPSKRAESGRYALTAVSARTSLTNPASIPDDLIGPRLLTKGGMWIVAGPPKAGKSDLLLSLFIHAAAGINFLGFAFSRPLRIFYAQSEIERPYLDERLQQIVGGNRRQLEPGLDNLFTTSRFKFSLDEQGVVALADQIMASFPDAAKPVDIIAIDPLRNVYQSGLGGGDINADILAFFTQRLEALLAVTNPQAGMVIIHHTNKITGKMLAEDPMAAISGGGALLSYPTAITILGKTGTEEDPSLTAWFDLRNGPPISSMTIGKRKGQWLHLDRPEVRLIRQQWGEMNDREQSRKRRTILEFIFDEAAEGRLYTNASMAKVLSGKSGLGSQHTIRNLISEYETKGFIRFIGQDAAVRYGLTRPKSPIGYLCVEGMRSPENLEYLPTHYRDARSDQVFELRQEEVNRWEYDFSEEEQTVEQGNENGVC